MESIYINIQYIMVTCTGNIVQIKYYTQARVVLYLIPLPALREILIFISVTGGFLLQHIVV